MSDLIPSAAIVQEVSVSPSTLPSIPERIAEATRHKDRGNVLFKSSDWPGAIGEYLNGLAALPARPPIRLVKPPVKDADDSDAPQSTPKEDESASNNNSSSLSTSAKGKARAEGERPGDGVPPTQPESSAQEIDGDTGVDDDTSDDPAVRNLRAVLHANVAACRAKQGEHQLVVDSCSEALIDDQKYTKALFRRAQANEALNTWTSLEAANKDYAAIIAELPESSGDYRNAKKAQDALTPRLEAAKQKEVDEMMGKLKGLGNSLLGKFGLSTDNFQFTPNGQGGYSMNFVNS